MYEHMWKLLIDARVKLYKMTTAVKKEVPDKWETPAGQQQEEVHHTVTFKIRHSNQAQEFDLSYDTSTKISVVKNDCQQKFGTTIENMDLQLVRDLEGKFDSVEWLTNTEKSLSYFDINAQRMTCLDYYLICVDNCPEMNDQNDKDFKLVPISKQ